jgi:hypothetical protein
MPDNPINPNINNAEQQIFNPSAQQQQDLQNQKDQQNADPQAVLVGAISDLDRRLRTLEERYSNLRQKIQITDQNLIEGERTIMKDFRNSNTELLELNRNVNDFSEKILMFKDEMDSTAQKKDLKVIEKYLELWDPNNFVTRNELREFLKLKKGDIEPEEDEDNSDE